LYLNKSSELVANEKATNFRVTNQNEEVAATSSTKGSWTLKEYKFQGGKINFTNDSKMAKTVEAAPSATDVEIAKGTLTIAEPIKLEGLTVNGTLAVADKNPIKTLKVEIGGSNYTAENPSINGTKVSWTFTDELYVSKTSDIRVLANIYATGDKANTITFDSIRGASFTK
jgi:hypothetical protein